MFPSTHEPASKELPTHEALKITKHDRNVCRINRANTSHLL